MNNDTTTPKPSQPKQPTDKGLDGAACCASYRLLTIKDTVHADDEFLTDDCQTWARVGDEALRFMIGRPYSIQFYQPMRRLEYPKVEAHPPDMKYTGHVPCYKCGKSHWMYANCQHNAERIRDDG